MSSTTIVEAPEPVQDTTFSDILKADQERSIRLEERAEEQRKEQERRDEKAKQEAAAALPGFQRNLMSQLGVGLINYQEGLDDLNAYIDKHGLRGGFLPNTTVTTTDTGIPDDPDTEEDESKTTTEIEQPAFDPGYGEGRTAMSFVDDYIKYGTTEYTPLRNQAAITHGYQTVFGREPTDDEIDYHTGNISLNLYTPGDITSQLKETEEYTKNFNDNYMDNYYDIQYGDQTLDEDGNKTGLRTFNFNPSLMPTLSNETMESAGITSPNFEEYFSGPMTVAELQAGEQVMRQQTQFAYQAGLTNLQGEISKELEQIKIQGNKEIQQIENFGDVASSLASGFFN